MRTIVLVGLMAACGSEPEVRSVTETDRFRQAANNEVDILWVVDDSGSMAEEQEALAAGFGTFVAELEDSGTDFQIGLIPTSFTYDDAERAVLVGDPPFLTPADDYVALFAERAVLGTGGEAKEKGLEAAVHAVEPTMTFAGGLNDGFVRPSAHLLIVFVSDEDDCSDRGALEGQPQEDCYGESDALVPVVALVEELLALKDRPSDAVGTPPQVQVGAIVTPRNGACGNPRAGSRYMEAAALTNGVVGDICDADWSSLLGDLGLTATGIQTTFRTSELARPETLEVTVDGDAAREDAVHGWTYDTDTWLLAFHGDGVPARGAEIVVKYEVQATNGRP